jgi:hypothetical protein
MATTTLERRTEVVADKERENASVVEAAATESRSTVTGSNMGEARAWNAKAQID